MMTEDESLQLLTQSIREILCQCSTDEILPFRILSHFHLLSWKYFHQDFIHLFRQIHFPDKVT